MCAGAGRGSQPLLALRLARRQCGLEEQRCERGFAGETEREVWVSPSLDASLRSRAETQTLRPFSEGGGHWVGTG